VSPQALNLVDNALLEGLAFAPVPLSCYLTFRLLDFPDVTVDGSFVLGGSVAALLIANGHCEPWLATLAAVPFGALAGACTGVLYVRLGINKLLAGILVAFALYSINLLAIGASLAFPQGSTVISPFYALDRYCLQFLPPGTLVHPSQILLFAVVFLAIKLAIDAYLTSEAGLFLRASPYCEEAIWHKGVNPQRYQILGVALANAIVALCGAFVAQKEGAANSFRGTGLIIVGIAAFIIGEQARGLCRSLERSVIRDSRAGVSTRMLYFLVRPLRQVSPTTGAAIGAFVYFFMVHLGYRLHLNPALPKLVMALLLITFIGNWRKAFRR